MGKDIVKVGLLGMGTIGSGVASLLQRNSKNICERTNINIILEQVTDRDSSRFGTLELDDKQLTTDASYVLENPEIDIIVELIGGLEPARSFIKKALENGKYVVTANKDLMAAHGEELLDLARSKNLNIFYEASVGGAIPVIRALKHSLVSDQIERIIGIVNGTTNYIFTRMALDNLSLGEALSEAQKSGFAEPVPTNDIEGLDAAYKLVILAGLAFGKRVSIDQVFVQGVGSVTHEDIVYAREIGYAIKLLAIGEKMPGGLALRVHPTLVPEKHPLASVLNEFNAIFIEGENAGELMFYGRGAGAEPTATAVVADVVEAARCISLQSSCSVIEKITGNSDFVPISKLSNRFYLRFLVEDRPGVFASLANVFGDENVSLDMVLQKRRVNNAAEIVLVTHLVGEDSFQRALARVMNLPVVKPNPGIIRLLG